MSSLPDWLVERAALGEVAPAMRARLEGADPAALAAQIEALRAEDAAELRVHPAAPAVAAIGARAEAARRAHASRRRRAGAAALVAVGGVAAALLAVRGDDGAGGAHGAARPGTAEEAPETTRVKGAQRLTAYRKVGDRAERLAPGAAVRAGDVLQLRYDGGGRSHGLIASIDGAGAVTLHFPAAADGSTALAASTSDLPHAYALDDAPRFERFFFVTDDEPIDVAAALGALRALARRRDADRAALELPPRVRQVALLLRKAPAP